MYLIKDGIIKIDKNIMEDYNLIGQKNTKINKYYNRPLYEKYNVTIFKNDDLLYRKWKGKETHVGIMDYTIKFKIIDKTSDYIQIDQSINVDIKYVARITDDFPFEIDHVIEDKLYYTKPNDLEIGDTIYKVLQGVINADSIQLSCIKHDLYTMTFPIEEVYKYVDDYYIYMNHGNCEEQFDVVEVIEPCNQITRNRLVNMIGKDKVMYTYWTTNGTTTIHIVYLKGLTPDNCEFETRIPDMANASRNYIDVILDYDGYIYGIDEIHGFYRINRLFFYDDEGHKIYVSPKSNGYENHIDQDMFVCFYDKELKLIDKNQIIDRGNCSNIGGWNGYMHKHGNPFQLVYYGFIENSNYQTIYTISNYRKDINNITRITNSSEAISGIISVVHDTPHMLMYDKTHPDWYRHWVFSNNIDNARYRPMIQRKHREDDKVVYTSLFQSYNYTYPEDGLGNENAPTTLNIHDDKWYEYSSYYTDIPYDKVVTEYNSSLGFVSIFHDNGSIQYRLYDITFVCENYRSELFSYDSDLYTCSITVFRKGNIIYLKVILQEPVDEDHNIWQVVDTQIIKVP